MTDAEASAKAAEIKQQLESAGLTTSSRITVIFRLWAADREVLTPCQILPPQPPEPPVSVGTNLVDYVMNRVQAYYHTYSTAPSRILDVQVDIQ